MPSSTYNNPTHDIWDETGDSTVNTHAHLDRSHYSTGYVDGLTKNKENNLQAGFDALFSKGAHLGSRVGSILASLKSRNSPLFNSAVAELKIASVLHKKYFDLELELLKLHELVKKWEEIVEGLESGN